MSIPSSFIDRLLSSVSIVDIINRRVQLERSGGRYKAKCPFHGDGNEKTPSFVVYEETGSYHCFACKASLCSGQTAIQGKKKRPVGRLFMGF